MNATDQRTVAISRNFQKSHLAYLQDKNLAKRRLFYSSTTYTNSKTLLTEAGQRRQSRITFRWSEIAARYAVFIQFFCAPSVISLSLETHKNSA